MVKVILGALGTKQDGWISTDKDILDITQRRSFEDFFENKVGCVDAFLAEHVWEHLSFREGSFAANLCRIFLKPGGLLRIAVPDALHPDPDYIDWVKPLGKGPGAEGHRILYDHIMLRSLLASAGFARVIPLEWWDESGRFNFKPWATEDGLVRRSVRYDSGKNIPGRPALYTSLIVDAVKAAVS